MSIVSVINMKGGVGKTTLTLALSDFLSSIYKKRVLLIDLDPQANLTMACVGEHRWADIDHHRMTVADIFDEVVRNVPTAPHIEAINRIRGGMQVHLIASTPRLTEVEAEAMDADQAWRRRVGSPYLVLNQVLAPILDAYDYALIDCPPSMGVITLNGLAFSDGYLVPVTPSPVSITGFELLQRKVSQFAYGLRRTITRYGTIINRVDTRTNLHAAIIRELQGNPEAQPVWTTQIHTTVRAEEGWDQSEPRTLSQRWGGLHSVFSALAEEFIRRVR
jgi:chromosome partitioning protein